MITPSNRVAIISGDRQVTFNQMLGHIAAYAEQCPQEAGVKTLILSENCEGWIYALYAVWHNRGIVVPVDAGSTAADVTYIIRDCAPRAIWASPTRVDLAKEAVRASGMEVEILLLPTGGEHPSREPQALTKRADNDTALICYTSGTTGSPKGVMLSFENIMANVRAVSTEVPIFNADRRTIVLLPLHHVLPLVGTAVIPFVVGGGVAISPSLAAADIMDTLQRGRIAIMIGVPRLWQTLFRGIKGKIDASGVTRALYNMCAKAQCRTLSRLIFKSVRTKMGGAITYCVAGGAALDTETAMGLKTLGLDVLEGYGMTEAAPMITFTRPGDIRPGCAGLPVPSVEVKLVDGELCARGRNVMQGYYNRPEETAAVIDTEGWLHTGDLATIDETQHVTITGRKKEIIVLSNGKNVNPTEIEEKIEHYADIVKEAAVTEKDDLLCLIVVPQPVWQAGKTVAEMERLIKDDILRDYNAHVAPYKKLMSLHIYQGELPRTRLEKLQRFKLQELLTATEAPAAETTPQEQMTGALGILASYISAEKHTEVKASDNLETDLALDSLDCVALQGFIEGTFGVTLSTEQLTAFPTLQQLADHIERSKTREEVEDIDWHKILTSQLSTANSQLPRMGLIGRSVMALCRMLMRPMFHPVVRGTENIPTSGPFILAPNHQSFMDAPLVVAGLQPDTLTRTYFYAKRDHVRGPLARLVARNHNVIVMDMRTLSDSIHQLGQVLTMGNGLVIFPEGTRTADGQVGAFRKTFAILAAELQVPIIPVRITGAYEAWPRTRLLPRRAQVSVEYLPAVLPPAQDKLQSSDYQTLADTVRAQITNNL